jgi:ADP-ribose pyrophosphatase YjhB (NUDIX family)
MHLITLLGSDLNQQLVPAVGGLAGDGNKSNLHLSTPLRRSRFTILTMGKKNKTPKKTISCGALTYRTDASGSLEILLIKQFSHKEKWGMPKGHIHDGESIEECAYREVKEETGIDVVLGAKLKSVVLNLNKEDKTVTIFLARPIDDEQVPSRNDPDCEVADVRWFKTSELPTIQEYQRSILNEALAILNPHVVTSSPRCVINQRDIKT